MLNLLVNACPLFTDIDWTSKRYSGTVTPGYVNDLDSGSYFVTHSGVLKSILSRTFNINTKWKETICVLPKGVTVPNNILKLLYTAHAGSTCIEVMCIRSPSGSYYPFTDGTKPDRLGHYAEAI